MFIAKPLRHLTLCLCLGIGWGETCRSSEGLSLGPLHHQFKLTLDPGDRAETLGPVYYSERKESTRLWASPPLFSYTLDEATDFEEFDFLYPLLSYDRFGDEYRFHIFQVFSFSGGKTLTDTNVHRFTLFPFYFQQRSAIPEKNYTALIPLYGHLRNRLLRNEVNFALMPLYVQTRKRDIITYNVPYPFFHLRYGDGLKGWQFWPLIGSEHKSVTTRTNAWGEPEIVGGHDKFFAAWPFFFNQTTGIGTENPERHQAFIPFYSFLRSPQRDSTTYFWPFGLTITDDRAKKYHEVGAPWPLVVFGSGEGKTTRRFWPLFSRSENEFLESTWYLWPLYKYNRVHSAPLDRERTRLLLFLYSDLVERNIETGAALHRVDFWPLFTFRRGLDGHERLQLLSILESLIPNNKSIERNWSPLWAFWRAEKNPTTGAASQSLLWNLYRREVSPGARKSSFLFGLFQHQSGPDGKRWRVFFLPPGKNRHPATPEPAPAPIP